MAPSLKDFYLKNYKLPNNGGTFQSPAPIVQGTENPMPQATWGNGAPVYQNPAPVNPASYVGKVNAPQTQAPIFNQQSSVPPQQTLNIPKNYINPQTGGLYSADEIIANMVKSIPSGGVSKYAGDAMMNPNESSQDLTARATNMNNARNDIAVGETDPYRVASKSGISYSGAELAAIEKAYAGIYDPALNDVFARLKTKEEEDKKKSDREMEIFRTNENIRQWKATTGAKSTGLDKSIFTDTDIKNGVKNSGLTFDEFNAIEEPEIINFFSRPPVYKDEFGKSVSYPAVLRNLVRLLKEGDPDTTIDDVTSFILDQDLPESVKQYYIDQLPIPEEKKEEASMSIWGILRKSGAIGFGVPGLFGPKF